MLIWIALLFFSHSSQGAVLLKSGCKIMVNEHLSDPQPLLLRQNDAVTHADAMVLPDDNLGSINLMSGESIDVACPGGEVIVSSVSTHTDLVPITCSSGITFVVNEKLVPFPEITCSKTPSHSADYTGRKCASKHREVEIGFQIRDRFIKHITTCFDDKLQHAVYSESYLVYNIMGSQTNYPRPDFQVNKFYNVTPDSVSNLYSRKGQTKTINGILGLEEDDSSIIHPTNNTFLATGHYTPKADFVFGAQQRLTFYYINAAPQWQTINGANWNTMEGNYRKLAEDRQTSYLTYTGSYGIASLPDVNDVEQELYLWVGPNGERGIPVPAQFYKVIYEPISQTGIVLLGFNNPHKVTKESDKICKDVCDKITWLTWKPENPDGISYCCDVNDFRQTVKDLPPFTVKSLLI